MRIVFEGGANFITAITDSNAVVVRCNTQYTDLMGCESLDNFVKRYGGELKCSAALLEFYKHAGGK